MQNQRLFNWTPADSNVKLNLNLTNGTCSVSLIVLAQCTIHRTENYAFTTKYVAQYL